jgi:PAS domain S-box-containing protein
MRRMRMARNAIEAAAGDGLESRATGRERHRTLVRCLAGVALVFWVQGLVPDGLLRSGAFSPHRFWSDHMFELNGVERTSTREVPGNLPNQLVHPEDRAFVRQSLAAARSGDGISRVEYRIVWPSDGQVRWMSASGRYYLDASGEPLRSAGVVFDITERRLAEEQLQRIGWMLDNRASARRRVLVVDDNYDSAESLATILQLAGSETHIANDGESAVEAARQLRPDIVVCDIGMPKLTGYDVARLIRGEDWGRQVLLIALTGWGQEVDRLRSEEAGFDHHLVKPVDPAQLMALIGQFLARTGS